MRIVVLDVQAKSRGALSILNDFYSFVKDHGRRHQWFFILSSPHFASSEHIRIFRSEASNANWCKRLGWEIFSIKKIIRQFDPDVIFSLQSTMAFGVRKPQVVYIHQSIPFQNKKSFSFLKPAERKLAFYQYIFKWPIVYSVRRAKAVVCQTQWFQQALMEFSRSRKIEFLVVHPHGKPDQAAANLGKQQGSEKTFFYPAGPEIYKNHQCILDAALILRKSCDHDFEILLTLTGEESKTIARMRDTVRKENLPVRFVGYLNPQEVDALYDKSTLIFPSYIETFGMPMMEAALHGGRILASDCDFSHETLSHYPNARFFDPFNPKQLANLMLQTVNRKFPLERTVLKDGFSKGWADVLKLLEEVGGHREIKNLSGS